jgi:DNA-directed RNA polymerase sigma subunit (sigma70/sigma32)
MACLEEQEQQIIRNRYLGRPPLSPCQLRKAMGGMKPEQLEQLEQQALTKLRRAAQECKHAFNA